MKEQTTKNYRDVKGRQTEQGRGARHKKGKRERAVSGRHFEGVHMSYS